MAANFDQAGKGQITADGTEPAVEVQAVANQLALILSGTFAVNVQIQISFDGSAFVDFEAAKTAAGHFPIPACHSVRLVASGYTSGAADWAIGGMRTV